MNASWFAIAAVAAPLIAAVAVALIGWRRGTAVGSVAAAAVVLGCGIALGPSVLHRHLFAVDHVLRADAVTAVMLLVIGTVSTLATWASIGYLDTELARGHTTPARARQYGVLVNIFIAAMTLAVLANNLGVTWVAVEATTISTAFLVGHHRTRASLEATWKYVIICSVGIALAFLGTVVLYFASLHTGHGTIGALDIDYLTQHAAQLNPAVTRLAAGLLLLGYGTKVGLAPFHTWLADAHSQAPAPVSALMSGVLLSVALSVLLRIKSVIDVALGPAFLRIGLLTVGLLTLIVAAALLIAQRDYKRMLAYSSLEHMGFLAVAAAAGTELALAAALLHVLAHGLGKSVLFISAGHLQLAHGSTSIADVTAVLRRCPILGVSLAGGLIAILGLPPFALFASEIGIARGTAGAHLALPLGIALALMVIAFAALTRHGIAMLFGQPAANAPTLAVSRSAAVPLLVGLGALVVLGVTTGPLTALLRAAASLLGGHS